MNDEYYQYETVKKVHPSNVKKGKPKFKYAHGYYSPYLLNEKPVPTSKEGYYKYFYMESYSTVETVKKGKKTIKKTVLHSRKKFVEVPAEQWKQMRYWDMKDFEADRDEYEALEYDEKEVFPNGKEIYYNVFDYMLQHWDRHNHEEFWINAFDLERVLNKLSDEDLDIYLMHKEQHLKQKRIAEIMGKSEAYITRRMKYIENAIEYDMLDDGEHTKTQIEAEMEFRKYLRSGKTESFIDVFVYDFLLIFPQEILLRYLFVFRGQQNLLRFCFLWLYEYFNTKEKPVLKAREVLNKYSYQLFKKYMITKKVWSQQLFIAVESEIERLLKRYGIKDSKPNEKFIKTVQKAAAARDMTVAEYRDKILFPHGKERIITRFKQFKKKQAELNK